MAPIPPAMQLNPIHIICVFESYAPNVSSHIITKPFIYLKIKELGVNNIYLYTINLSNIFSSCKKITNKDTTKENLLRGYANYSRKSRDKLFIIKTQTAFELCLYSFHLGHP